ncbi:alpha/beta hydrolase [Dictyobacter alpinus]|uniref:Alpha/beta hydrolase n=1 Tax=Dictyobacter alpinus TaxID=2014873 RepID=A0A402BC34_9CHLR|nr:alpha/beta hydrolase [Dictyobacter alpinus]GCE28943.1 alpha/beta hydrolase [Dictyobacter alpinus]
MSSNVNIVLVHGAFCDGSSWAGVIPLLQEAGHHVVAVQLPLVSLSSDIAVVKSATASLAGPTILAAHSYGGAVITGAGSDLANVTGLVYIAAYAPAEGETLGDLNQKFPPTEGQGKIGPSYLENALYIDPEAFPQVFAADVEPVQARVLAAVQRPTGLGCLTEKSGPPAWQKLPSWYLVSENDKTINPDAERWMAQRAGSTTSAIASSHASPVSHPREVADLILTAAQASAK